MNRPKDSEKAKSTVIVKRIKRNHGGAHGAAWKIAYADFVTAMMAFFLLMWLLGSTTRGDLKGIRDYFTTPLQIAQMDGPGVGNTNTIVPGGGDYMSQSDGEQKRAQAQEANRRVAMMQRRERERMQALALQLDQAIRNESRLQDFRNQILVEITPDGLRIQIVDDQKRPMFDVGSAHPKDYMRDVLRDFGRLLSAFEGRFVLTGHTDSLQYTLGDRNYSNWELSIDRANAARRELIAGGLEPGQVARVVGLADSSPLDRDDPSNPINRRISIIVLDKEVEKRSDLSASQ